MTTKKDWKSSWKKKGGAWTYEPSERVRKQSKPDDGQQDLFPEERPQNEEGDQ